MTKKNNIFEIDPTIEDKKQLFIDATIYCLAEYGFKETTVRKIAEMAKVAPGLLTHYYSGKEVLIAESYKYLAKKFLDLFHERIASKKNNPIEALQIFIKATFEKDNLNPKMLRVWLTFWSLTLTHKDLKHIHKENYRQYIASIERLLIQAYQKDNKDVDIAHIRSLAIGIIGLLDGLWVEWCLDPNTFSPHEALQIVYNFVESTTGLKIHPAN